MAMHLQRRDQEVYSMWYVVCCIKSILHTTFFILYTLRRADIIPRLSIFDASPCDARFRSHQAFV